MNYLQEDLLAEARNYFIENNYKMAEPILQQLILQNIKKPEIFQMLGTICYDKGQFNKAIKAFRRALEIDPVYTDASIGLSIILNDLGRYEEGKEVFSKAQELLDKKGSTYDDPYINEKLASKHEELADLYSQYKRYNEALEQMLKAYRLSSRKPEMTMRLADIYTHLSQTEMAVRDLQQLIKEYPQFLPARLKLGTIYYNNHNVAEATEQWEAVLNREPKHPEALRMLKMAQTAGITSLEY